MRQQCMHLRDGHHGQHELLSVAGAVALQHVPLIRAGQAPQQASNVLCAEAALSIHQSQDRLLHLHTAAV